MSAPLASAGPSAYWYLTRSTGAVSLMLLTVAVALGVIEVLRVSAPAWPRFLIDSLHRNVALLALVFLALHIITSVVDSFASISLVDVFVPFVGSYRPLWLGLGVVAFDLILAVILTSLLRSRIGFARWRAVHWLAYASWPIALLHGLGTGSDAKSAWMLTLTLGCLTVVIVAVVVRVRSAWQSYPERARMALGSTGAFTLFFALWLPSGPLGAEWARRSGTPRALLGPRHHGPAAKDGRR